MPKRLNPLRFSRTGLRGLNVSATLALNDRVRELWQAGQNVYHLGFGEARFPVHPKIAGALQANVQRRSYLPALGLPELRETIARFYQRKFDFEVSPDQVVVGPGSKSLLYALTLALGDEIILPQPSWVSYAPQAQLVGKPITWVPTRAEKNYLLEIDIFQQQLETSRRKFGNPELLIINSPNNPTGTMIPSEKVKELADFARHQGLTVVSDEIYALTAFGSIPHTSILQFYPEGSIVLGGLSKHLSLGGWRFGLAILPPGPAGEALRQAIQTVAGSIWSCVTAPVQYAAMVAYGDDPEIEAYIELCTRIHTVRTRYLYDLLVEIGVPCVEPTGAFYVFPSFKKWNAALARRGIYTDEALALHLLENYEIATLPGSAFNYSPQGLCLRLSSSYIDAETDEQGAHLLEAFTHDPEPDLFIESHHPRLRQVAGRLADFVNDLKED